MPALVQPMARAEIAATPTPRWTPRSRLIAAFVVGWLVVQAFVPVIILGQPRPARFGWQMYTATTSLPTISLRTTDGRVVPIDVSSTIARDRSEASYLDALILALCARDGAAAVIVGQAGTERERACH